MEIYNFRRPVKVMGDVAVGGNIAVTGVQTITGDLQLNSETKLGAKLTSPAVSGDIIHNAHVLVEDWLDMGATGLAYKYDVSTLLVGTGTNAVSAGTNVLTTSGTATHAEGTQLIGDPVRMGSKLTRLEYKALTLTTATDVKLNAGFMNATKYARLRFDTATDTNFIFEFNDGSGAVTIDTGVAGDTAAHTAVIEFDSDGKLSELKLDGSDVTISAGVAAMTFDDDFTAYHSVTALGAAARVLTVGAFELYYAN